MRRRKLNGLAGSAEHHASKVTALEARARNMFRASGSLANDSRCGLALEEYADAVKAMGMAQVHKSESGSRRDVIEAAFGRASLRESFQQATERLKARCVIPSNLRGMPRRRRR